MIQKYIFIVSVALITSPILALSQSAWDPTTQTGKAQKSISSPRPATVSSIAALEAYLNASLKQYGNNVDKSRLDLYLEARTKFEISRPLIEKKPRSPEAAASFTACSLLTEAAVLQLVVHSNESRVSQLRDSLSLVLRELTIVQKNIAAIEQGQASKIKADLDAEKNKSQKLRDEAEKKFAQLQNSLISVTNDARGTIISMSDILFESGKAVLTANLEKSLAKIAGILMVFKNSKINIEGHTDNQGTDEYNMKLSYQRASNVMSFLSEQGVEGSRLTANGFGFSRPIADNASREGRQKNRRVDLIVQEIKPAE
ncbi:MAG: OmpA family protein [Chitinivibrionales bacterium]|nr:OmpA family protein [Chitinivibrionales bacterium]